MHRDLSRRSYRRSPLHKEIAQRLILSPRTIETHVERVLEKLEVGSRSRAIAKAIRLGFVSL
jgi:DNA-binding CsgD family transcriptional regulator